MAGIVQAEGMLPRKYRAVHEKRRHPVRADKPRYGGNIPYFLAPCKMVFGIGFKALRKHIAQGIFAGKLFFKLGKGGKQVRGHRHGRNMNKGAAGIK